MYIHLKTQHSSLWLTTDVQASDMYKLYNVSTIGKQLYNHLISLVRLEEMLHALI